MLCIFVSLIVFYGVFCIFKNYVKESDKHRSHIPGLHFPLTVTHNVKELSSTFNCNGDVNQDAWRVMKKMRNRKQGESFPAVSDWFDHQLLS